MQPISGSTLLKKKLANKQKSTKFDELINNKANIGGQKH